MNLTSRRFRSGAGTSESEAIAAFTLTRPACSRPESWPATEGRQKTQASCPWTQISPTHSRRTPRANSAPR